MCISKSVYKSSTICMHSLILKLADPCPVVISIIPPLSGFGTDKSDLAISSRHYLAMKKLVSDNNFDALAIRCWPEVSQALFRCDIIS